MASFQAKIDWERLGESENKKKIVPMSFYPTRNTEFHKNNKKKIQKTKKYHCGFFSSQNRLEKAKKERK